MAKRIPYTKDLKIVNVEQLPKGLGCRYLEVTEGQGPNVYVAARWRRNLNSPTPAGRIIIDFGGK